MSRDRFPRVPVQATEAQLPGIAALLGASDAGACVEVTDGLSPGLRRWTGSAFVALSAYTVEADNAHPTSAALPSTYPLGASTCSITDTTGWTAARPPGQGSLTTPIRLETFRNSTNGALQRVSFRDVTGLPVTWERTATADAWNASAFAAETPDRVLLSEYNEFVNTTSTGVWAQSNSGTSAGWASVLGIDNTFGLVQANAGTTATGRAFYGAASAELDLGACSSVLFNTRLYITTLSTATDTYTNRAGLLDNNAAEPTDGLYFRYTNAVNGGRWQAVVRSNGVETATDTGVAVTTAWYELSVVFAAGAVTFRINGTVVHTTSAGLPSGTARRLGWGVGGIKSAGITNVSMMWLDWAEIKVRLSTVR